MYDHYEAENNVWCFLVPTWEITPSPEIINRNFTKSVIKSKASMIYKKIQLIINDQNQNTLITIKLRQLLINLLKFLKKRRRSKCGVRHLLYEPIDNYQNIMYICIFLFDLLFICTYFVSQFHQGTPINIIAVCTL